MSVEQRLSLPVAVALSGLLAVGCKTTERTNKEPGESGPETATDVDEDPTTVLPDDTGSADSATGDASADTSDETGVRTGEIWPPPEGDFVLKDRETGTLWNARGQAYAGPLEGKQLRKISAFNSFWFAWSVFYDGSTIWQHDGEAVENTPGGLGDGDSCEVPCNQITSGGPPKDGIPALDYDGRSFAGDPRPKETEMVEPGSDGTGYLSESTFVLGVVVDGQARAYPHNLLWHHEIHNDRIGDREFSVTFCPLTGSGLVFEGTHEGEPIRFSTSGRLFKSNLVMFDPSTDTYWSQMMRTGIKGQRSGQTLDLRPVVETTWKRWKEMHPDTLVTSADTGYDRPYQSYPYSNYRSNNRNTFGTSGYEQTYPEKKRVLGLPATPKGESLAFPFPEMDKLEGDRNAINANVDGEPIVVYYEAEHRMAIPFSRTVDGRQLTFVGARAE